MKPCDIEIPICAALVAQLTNKTAIKDYYEAEFNVSVGKLAPLLKRIKATDELIDAIIYKHYGLTEDEIKIVEASISGEKNAESSKT